MKIPLMINMEGPAIVIGGGKVGMHKVSQLSKLDVDIILIDREDIVVPSDVKFIRAELDPDNLKDLISKDAVLVVSALEDRDLNAMVSKHCQANGILVNVVDDPELSTVFFMAFSKKGDIIVSVTTSGQCPFRQLNMR